MVRIINGEIVSDDDPRVAGAQQRRSSAGVGGGGQGRTGYGGRVASLLDPPSSSGPSGGSSREPAAGGARGAGGQGGPLDKLAQMIGVHGRSVTIPGALGVQQQQIPYIYLMIAAVVVLFGGWKAAGVIIFAYVITNQQGRAR